MNPEMMMYMMQNPQASHEGASEDVGSPFSAGALAAIKSAKRSLGMDEEEKRRAAGLAIAKFFSGMAKPGYGEGFAGTLGAAASNVAPALEAYQGEEKRVGDLNSALMKQQTDYALEQKKMKQQVAQHYLQQAHRDARQQEVERHHQAMERRQDALLRLKATTGGMKANKLQKEEEKQERIEKLLAEGEYPVEMLEPSARSDLQKDDKKLNKDIPVNQIALQTLDKLDEIFKDNQKMGESFLQGLDISPGKRPSFFTQLARKFSDKKTVAAIQKAIKLSNDLNLQVILDAPTKTASNLFKEQVAKANPNEVLDYEAYKDISKGLRNKIKGNIEKAHFSRKALKKRVVPDFSQLQTPSKVQELPGENSSSDRERKIADIDKQIAEIEALVRQGNNSPEQGAMMP